MSNWADLDSIKYQNETEAARDLVVETGLSREQQQQIDARSVDFVIQARKARSRKGLMQTFLEEFGLSNKEGVALMCLAESLLRVPDTRTADKLIAEAVSSGDWGQHKGQSDSWLVNASTLGLMLTGRVVDLGDEITENPNSYFQKLTRRLGAPVIRSAMMQAMRIMGEQFVFGRNIDQAMERADKNREGAKKRGADLLYSFDMLGEGARTESDARRYFEAYRSAMKALAKPKKSESKQGVSPELRDGISVKLSALHPRYEALHEDAVMATLYPRLLELAELAAAANINLCLDAEEADRLVLSLKILERLVYEPALGDWAGLGLALQAYQKRSRALCKKIVDLARLSGRRLMVRLVKGAYWDSEIKHGQIEGVSDYSVWTRKRHTDLCYINCARLLFDGGDIIYPQFATHNAHTVAAIEEMAKSYAQPFEFQRLHGMGEALYHVIPKTHPVRVYAPVGAHKDLLPYLVRRLLENGANTSFVYSFLDDDVPPDQVSSSPFTDAPLTPHSKIPVPPNIFGPERQNSRGLDLTIDVVRENLTQVTMAATSILATPIINGKLGSGKSHAVYSPFNAEVIGEVVYASEDDIALAHEAALTAFRPWNKRGGAARAKILRDMAKALQDEMPAFIALMAREAGKIFSDCISEVREAVDFLRYYANEAERLFDAGTPLKGPVGETDTLYMTGRGVFVCISPWNFPLAIFTGQIAAALAAGNTVLAKPAEQTNLTAFKAVELFYKAGLPKDVLHLLPGLGETVGAALVDLPNIAGVCFTGSTAVAKTINKSLALKAGPIPVLIAETGGFNAMFVDTSALREQVISDVIMSAFNAAGQRCSALRILFLPEETADMLIEGIMGAMDSLVLGDPRDSTTDVGPVIDGAALSGLQTYISELPASMTLLKQCEIPKHCADGHFMPPSLIALRSLEDFNSEQFGPILHVVRYAYSELEGLLQSFCQKGYGLTLGIHSRLESFVRTVTHAAPAGNIYVNRNMIGAVVGVQPFGGFGMSGTGPKAGGPHYVSRFGTEICITDNISATGGDPDLLNLSE